MALSSYTGCTYMGQVLGTTGSVPYWHPTRTIYPCIMLANQSSGYSSCPPAMMVLEPGPNGEVSVIRWTAPNNGTINLLAVFNPGESGITTVVLLRNQGFIWSATDSGIIPPLITNVTVGETFDFTMAITSTYYSCTIGFYVQIKYLG